MDNKNIDMNKLRNDLHEDSLGAAFGGGFGGALLEADKIKKASDEDLIKIASQNGVNIEKYKK